MVQNRHGGIPTLEEEKSRKWEGEKMRRWEDEKIRRWEDEKMKGGRSMIIDACKAIDWSHLRKTKKQNNLIVP